MDKMEPTIERSENNMKKALLVFVIITSLCLNFAFASGSKEGSSDGVVRLTFRQNDAVGEVGGLLQAIDAFNAQNPGIHVTYEQVPWDDALNQFIREGHAGGGADVFQGAFVWTRDLADAGLLMKLDDFIKTNPPGNGLDDFIGTDLGEINDSIYGIPWSVDTYVMAYNPELFKKAGIASFPETWDELYIAAKTITEETDAYGLGFPGSTWFAFNYYLWSNGNILLAQDGDGAWHVASSEAVLEDAINYFARFFKENINPKTLIGATNWGDVEILDGLSRGDIAMAFLPPAPFRVAQSKAKTPLQTAKIPMGTMTRRSHLGGRVLLMNKNTKHPEEAWKLIQFLVSKDVFDTYQYPQFPAQVTMLSKLQYANGENGYAEQLPHAVTLKQYIVSPAPVSGMENVINRALTSVYSGEKSARDAARDMIKGLDGLMEN